MTYKALQKDEVIKALKEELVTKGRELNDLKAFMANKLDNIRLIAAVSYKSHLKKSAMIENFKAIEEYVKREDC
jgi:hypothetical protein